MSANTKEVEILVNGVFYRKETVSTFGYDITKILLKVRQERDQGLFTANDPMVVRVRPVKS